MKTFYCKILLIITLCLAGFDICTAADITYYPKFRADDSNGQPMAFGQVYSYVPGTTTPKATYTSSTGDVANTNPVVLDNKGEADIYTIGPTKLVLKKKVGSVYVTQWEEVVEGPGDIFGNYKYPDYEAPDQGAADAAYTTVKDIIDGLADYEEATIFFPHNSGGVTTAYQFLTAETIPSNVTLEFENGAILDLTIGGNTMFIQGQINAGPKQQIFNINTGTITGGQTANETIWPHWFGIDGTADQVEIMYAINWAQAASKKCLIPWSAASSLSGATRYDIADSVYIPAGRNYVAMADVGPSEFASTGRSGLFEWSGGTATPNAIVKVGRQNQSYISGICASASAIGDTDQGENIAGWLFYNPDENGSNYGHNLFEKITAKSCDYGFLLGNAGTLAIPDDSNGNWYGPNSGYATPDTQTNFNHCIWRSLQTFDCANSLVYDADNSDNSWIDGFVAGGTGQREAAREHEIYVRLLGNQLTMNKIMMTGFKLPEDNAMILIEDGDGILTDLNAESGEADATTDLASTTTYWDITDQGGNTFRYTYASGTDPGDIAALTTPSAAWATPYITLSGDISDPNNKGGFDITDSGTTWFEVTNASGVSESGIRFDHMYYLDPEYRRVLDINFAAGARGQWTVNNLRFTGFRDDDGVAIKSLFRAGLNLNGISSSGDITYGGPTTATSCVFENGYGFTQFGSSGNLQHIGTWEKSGGLGTNISGNPMGDLTIDTFQTTDFALRSYGHMFNKHNTSAFLTDNTAIDILTWVFDAGQAGSIVVDLTYSIGNMSASAAQALEGGRILMTAVQDTGNNITTNITESESTQVLDGYSGVTTTWAVDSATTNTVTITLNQDNNLNSTFRGQFFTTIMATDQSEADADKTKFSWDF